MDMNKDLLPSFLPFHWEWDQGVSDWELPQQKGLYLGFFYFTKNALNIFFKINTFNKTRMQTVMP